MSRPGLAVRWRSFEGWVGTRSSAVALFGLALCAFAIQSIVLPAYPGRDMARYVQTYVQYFYDDAVLPSVLNTRGPFAALGVGVPLELGGVAAEVFLAVLYAASIVAWGAVAMKFGARTAIVTTGLLLVYPGYGILFHGLASDSLFAAAFAGWALLLSRAILRPSRWAFFFAGLGMGALVLVRPSNQALILMALVPLFLRADWMKRLEWVAAFFVASALVTQSWRVLMTVYYGDAVALDPSGAVVVVALALSLLLLPGVWRRRVLWAAIPLVVAGAALVAVRGSGLESPTEYARRAVQSPPTSVFLFRAFELDRIVAPENGSASRELARAVERDLLTKEPYRSYGVDMSEFFSSGSDRVFSDMTKLQGVDLPAVTEEAIRAHPRAFVSGIAGTIWAQLWARRVFAPAGAPEAVDGGASSSEGAFVVVDGRRLPRPSEGQPIPASLVGPVIWTLGGEAREVWKSATEHPLVFDDPRDEQRYATFERDTDRLASRIPTRDANNALVHRLNQASNRFPPPVFWIAVSAIALLARRPERSLLAIALAAAGLVVIVTTSLVAPDVPEYAVPVTPAFVLLAAVGLVGANPRARLRLPWRRP